LFRTDHLEGPDRNLSLAHIMSPETIIKSPSPLVTSQQQPLCRIGIRAGRLRQSGAANMTITGSRSCIERILSCAYSEHLQEMIEQSHAPIQFCQPLNTFGYHPGMGWEKGSDTTMLEARKSFFNRPPAEATGLPKGPHRSLPILEDKRIPGPRFGSRIDKE